MENMLSPNVTSGQNNYSAPLPFIGLYTVAATMVCFLFILLDVIQAIPLRNTWIRCRFFTFNSVTLTLLSIAAKLPVDLTTALPSSLDQFSKLTGTALICVCMCFLFPSLGVNSASECITNMASLSIFVLTIVVNISIQMSTGVIFTFIPEHFIIMSFMIILLFLLWVSAFYINSRKIHIKTREKTLFPVRPGESGGESMFQQLKCCYVDAYKTNPQLILCRDVISRIVSMLSFFCLILVLQVTLRALIQDGYRFFSASSDYGWSMRLIVGSQILVILLGSLATSFRGLIKGSPVYLEDSPSFSIEEVICCISELRQSSLLGREKCLYDVLKLIMCSVYCFIICIPYTMYNCVPELQECYYGIFVDKWTKKKCDYELERMTSVKKRSSQSPLMDLLSKYSSPLYSAMDCTKPIFLLVFLERIASLCTPSLSGSLTEILIEVFEVIHFVDNRLYSWGDEHLKWSLSYALRVFIPKTFKRSRSQSDLQHALEIIEQSKLMIRRHSSLRLGLGSILYEITDRQYISVEQLYSCIEELFAGILCKILIQFPEAVAREFNESSVEDYEKKVRYMFKLACQWDTLITQWSFPVGSDIEDVLLKM